MVLAGSNYLLMFNLSSSTCRKYRKNQTSDSQIMTSKWDYEMILKFMIIAFKYYIFPIWCDGKFLLEYSIVKVKEMLIRLLPKSPAFNKCHVHLLEYNYPVLSTILHSAHQLK